MPPMPHPPLDRRTLLAGSAAAALAPAAARAAPLPAHGIDAARYGVRSGATDDQSVRLQRAMSRSRHSAISARARWAVSGDRSRTRTSRPAAAQVMAIPWPMVPAPTMPTVRTFKDAGRAPAAPR